MALILPANYASDIQGRDTALVPIVIIGNHGYGADSWEANSIGYLSDAIHISTNQMSYGHLYGAPEGWVGDERFSTLPILLNIPSLKESIDIEKRNYKISSINIDISNFKHEGLRFSERVSDSLINTELRVYWWSPSTEGIVPVDTNIGYNDDRMAFQVFTGSVRRYTHDDEKVRLVVEDRSQATLHKDLPLDDLTDDDVPDKYKNKPIPMVYGYVDRSPMVIKIAPTEAEWGEGNIEILADNSDSTTIGGNSPIAIFNNDTYLNIPGVLDIQHTEDGVESTNFVDNIFGFVSDTPQYTIENNFISLSTSGSFDDEFPSPVFLNKLLGYDTTPYTDLLYSKLNQISTYWTGKEIAHGFHGRSWYGTVRSGLEFAGSLVLEEERGDWQGGSFIENMQLGTSTWGSGDIDIYSQLYNHASGDSNHHERAMMGCTVQTGTVSTSSFANKLSMLYFDIGVEVGSGYTYGGGDDKKIRLRVGGDSEGDTGAGGNIDFIVDVDDADSSTQWHDLTDQPERGKGWTVIETPDNLLIYCRIADHGTYGWGHFAAKITINNLRLYHYALIEDILSQDFYANANGRVMQTNGNSPSSISVIVDILNKELGQPDVTAQTDTYGWQYAFTVDKKIDSKKLIEGIASASPYIPRFDNMGAFKFDVIKESYGDTDLNDVPNSTILSDDVIDYSYSRTKIEDVYTKVVFKYNYDYARDIFSSSVTADIGVLLGLDYYNYDHYGLKLPIEEADGTYTHPESTLIIDDDRSKYIRNPDTAKGFAEWMLMWSINQHLIMKVKLPLKYMNLEIGDIIEISNSTDGVLGGIEPYGINYIATDAVGSCIQPIYPYFMITSTSKTLEYCEISAMQMHNLEADCVDVDCAGICNGGAIDDDCGVCGGSGAPCTDCYDEDDNLYYPDCNGDCDGTAQPDQYQGQGDCPSLWCVGGNSGNDPCVKGCMDSSALNYDEAANVPDDCLYPLTVDWCLNQPCDEELWTNCAPWFGGIAQPVEYNMYLENINSDLPPFPVIASNTNYNIIIFKNGLPASYGYGTPQPVTDEEIGAFQQWCYEVQYGNVTHDNPGIVIVSSFCSNIPGGEPSEYTIEEVSIVVNNDPSFLKVFSVQDYPAGMSATEGTYSYTLEAEQFQPGDIPGLAGFVQGNIFHGFSMSGLGAQSFWEQSESAATNQYQNSDFRDQLMFYGFKFKIRHPEGDPIANVILLLSNLNAQDFLFQLHDVEGWGTPEGATDWWQGAFDAGMDSVTFEEEEFTDTFTGESTYWTIVTVAYDKIPLLKLEPDGVEKVNVDGGVEIKYSLSFDYISEGLTYGNYFAGREIMMNYELLREHCPPLGDLDGDAGFNILDIVLLINCVLAQSGGPGLPCPDLILPHYGCATDMNGDGEYNVLDIVILANCVLAENCGG